MKIDFNFMTIIIQIIIGNNQLKIWCCSHRCVTTIWLFSSFFFSTYYHVLVRMDIQFGQRWIRSNEALLKWILLSSLDRYFFNVIVGHFNDCSSFQPPLASLSNWIGSFHLWCPCFPNECKKLTIGH